MTADSGGETCSTTNGMSIQTLSAVIEKLIHRLCLTDFPCGSGSWKKNNHGEEREEWEEGEGDTEETDSLLDLLICPHSPWRHETSWSPQAQTLRKLAVVSPGRLRTNFIYKHFTTLRIVDKNVSVIDEGLLKFSKLEELVLSANTLSEVSAVNLPSSLRILELRANRLTDLTSLTRRPPPRLQYLSLGSNPLGFHKDAANLTGRYWPQLVCLDLSHCEFEEQQVLLSALTTLPCLKTLVLLGNPFTLAPSYPGLTVDTLPRLSCLDNSWISLRERHSFRGLAKIMDMGTDQAVATVRVGRVNGILNPLKSVDSNSSDFPVVTYGYLIMYSFPTRQTPVTTTTETTSKSELHPATEDNYSDVDPQSNNYRREKSTESHNGESVVNTEEECCGVIHVPRHKTWTQSWSDCMDYSDTQVYIISDLRDFKTFLNQGLHLWVEEEKVLSWPAVPGSGPVSKPSHNVKLGKKEEKEKESAMKSKDKKKSGPELVQGSTVRRILGSVHVPLQNLVTGDNKVDLLCDISIRDTASEDLNKKIKEEKKKDDKRKGGSGTEVKKAAQGKKRTVTEKEPEVDVQLHPVTVELSVKLEKWSSASEARKRLRTQQDC